MFVNAGFYKSFGHGKAISKAGAGRREIEGPAGCAELCLEIAGSRRKDHIRGCGCDDNEFEVLRCDPRLFKGFLGGR
jgi:hypothetical protein